jgi:sortase A
MGYWQSLSRMLRRHGLGAALLILVASLSVSCQLSVGAGDQTDAQAAGIASPVTTGTPNSPSATITPTIELVTPTPVPNVPVAPVAPDAAGSPGTPVAEIDAASNIISVDTAKMPKGPGKEPPTRLIIPSIGVDIKVIELGTHYNQAGEKVWDTAPFAAGHHVGTPNPGERGNVVISGHISSYQEGAVFKRLPEINVGDGVIVSTEDQDFLYRVVDKQVVLPTQIEVMNSTDEETLTLITCVPDGVFDHRLIVVAKRV